MRRYNLKDSEILIQLHIGELNRQAIVDLRKTPQGELGFSSWRSFTAKGSLHNRKLENQELQKNDNVGKVT